MIDITLEEGRGSHEFDNTRNVVFITRRNINRKYMSVSTASLRRLERLTRNWKRIGVDMGHDRMMTRYRTMEQIQ